jgi:hypothetical protein
MDISSKVAESLARRSSRRQFFKFLGAGSLGVGLMLSRTEATLGAITACVGCGGGPCNPCGSPFVQCSTLPCRPCQQGGGCPETCATTGEWFCCLTSGSRTGCRFRCSECSCPGPQGCCRCFTDLPMPCTPRQHSGDQPCTCAQQAPIPSLALDG